MQLEEHFSSLQEEVEVKTRKLKKLYGKYQGAMKEQEDLQMEFNTERMDMLETIRQLSRTIKLKDLVMSNFMPEESVRLVETRAQWVDEEDAWVIPVSVCAHGLFAVVCLWLFLCLYMYLCRVESRARGSTGAYATSHYKHTAASVGDGVCPPAEAVRQQP